MGASSSSPSKETTSTMNSSMNTSTSTINTNKGNDNVNKNNDHTTISSSPLSGCPVQHKNSLTTSTESSNSITEKSSECPVKYKNPSVYNVRLSFSCIVTITRHNVISICSKCTL